MSRNGGQGELGLAALVVGRTRLPHHGLAGTPAQGSGIGGDTAALTV